MARFNVDIDLDEIDSDDLVEEVERRMNPKKWKSFDKNELAELRKLFKAPDETGLPNVSLDDKMKIEHLTKVWNSYTASDFESLIPEKL